MKKIGIVITLLLLGAGGIWFWHDPDRNVIDDEFTKSEEFQLLNKQWEEEKRSAGERESAISLLVKQMLSQTGFDERTLPVRLDSVSISALLTEESKIPLGRNHALFSQLSAESIYRYGRIQLNGVSALLFLVKAPGVYRDVDMLLATVKDSSLVDLELILQYRKNLTEEVSGEAVFEGQSNNIIIATIDNQRFYPVEQNNTITYRYAIKEDGNIETQIVSES